MYNTCNKANLNIDVTIVQFCNCCQPELDLTYFLRFAAAQNWFYSPMEVNKRTKAVKFAGGIIIKNNTKRKIQNSNSHIVMVPIKLT